MTIKLIFSRKGGLDDSKASEELIDCACVCQCLCVFLCSFNRLIIDWLMNEVSYWLTVSALPLFLSSPFLPLFSSLHLLPSSHTLSAMQHKKLFQSFSVIRCLGPSMLHSLLPPSLTHRHTYINTLSYTLPVRPSHTSSFSLLNSLSTHAHLSHAN